MSYFPFADIEMTKWCSDQNPQGRCKPLKNICKPMDVPAAELFKDYQRELNRALFVKRKAGESVPKALWVDARPGPETVKATNAFFGTSFSHCDALCTVIDNLIGQLQTFNAAAGAPAVVAEGGPPVIDSGKGIDLGPLEPKAKLSTAGLAGALTSPLGLAALGIGAILLWKSQTPKAKKKRKARRKAKRRVTYSWF
jgi:hypothetical protein